jgi:hypothetical protein
MRDLPFERRHLRLMPVHVLLRRDTQAPFLATTGNFYAVSAIG